MTTISENYAAFFNWLVRDYSGDIVPTSRKDLSVKFRNEKKIECCENCFGAQPAQKMVKMVNEATLEALQKAKIMILLSLPGDYQFFEELKKETKILFKDTQNRITKIQLKERRRLMFEGDYTPERWRKQNKRNWRSNQPSSSTDRQNSIGNNVNTRKRNDSNRLDASGAGISQSRKRRRANSSAGSTSELPQTVQMNQGIEETSSSTYSAPPSGNDKNRRIENESSATNSFSTSQHLASTLSPSEIENLRKGRPYLRQITLRGPNWNLTENDNRLDHFRNLPEDLQSFFKNRRNYKLDAKLEEVKRNSEDEKTSPAAIALQIPVMMQKLCKIENKQHGLLVSSFFEDMVAFVASSSDQDVRILGKKNLGRTRRALRKKMNLTVSYDDIKAAIVNFLVILAWLSSSV